MSSISKTPVIPPKIFRMTQLIHLWYLNDCVHVIKKSDQIH